MTATCTHCGTPFVGGGRFCCPGCEFVAGMIDDRGLERFYELRGNRTLAPVGSAVFQARETSWLDRAIAAAAHDGDGRSASVDVSVQGIACIGCVWLIETVFDETPGALRIGLDAPTGRARLEVDPVRFDAARFAAELQGFGYLLGKPDPSATRGGALRALTVRVGVCGFLAMNAMAFTLPRYLGMDPDEMLAGFFELLAIACATLSLFAGGSFFISRAAAAARSGMLSIDTPLALGILLAFGGSLVGWLAGIDGLLYFDFVAVFIFLMLLGRWVQERVVDANRSRLLAGSGMPEGLVRLPDGDPLEAVDVRADDRVRVPPGGTVPVSSELVGSAATVSLESINGEPEPRPLSPGANVPSGAINLGAQPIDVLALEAWEGSLLSALVRDAPGAARDRRLERILKIYLLVVLVAAFTGGAAWFVAAGDLGVALAVSVSVLVVSCPCALGVALPLADEICAAGLRRHGVYVKQNGLWGRLRAVRRIVFDKTGTLTLEVPQLEDPEVLGTLGSPARSALWRLVERSRHPVGLALKEALACRFRSGQLETDEAAEVEETVGIGVEATLAGCRWSLGKPETGGTNDVELRADGALVAGFRFCEAIRQGARDEVAALERRGLNVGILSGDRSEKVARMAAALGIDPAAAYGALTPTEKAALVAEGTLFIGDGANDSLAFDAATCRGTPAVDHGVLRSRADFFFVGRGLAGIRALFATADVRRRAVAFTFAVAIAYNACAVAACLAGLMNPLVAAVVMPLSSLASVAVVVLSLRVRTKEK